MKPQLELLNERLTQEDRAELHSIFAPRVVMTPPMDTRCGLCVLPDGEIRYYGFDKEARQDFSTPVYWSSQDCGLSWKKRFARGPAQHASALRSPYSGRYISAVSSWYPETGLNVEGERIVYAALSDSPAATDFRLIPITNRNVTGMYLPIALRKRERVVCAAHLCEDNIHHPAVLFSDDEGESWGMSVLETVPRHEALWPHRGVRWQNEASEPTLAELSDGTLLLLARTSLDVLYQYVSKDGGETWSEPSPTSFHSTLTSPQLLSLSDGRLLLFWCNTQPLPEMDHEAQRPELTEREKQGQGEDFFTNRDACHAAISEDDGKTWRGFREIFLNEIRDRSDYRSLGGCANTLDKSVHQFQAVELPEGRVLLSFGQHPAARRAVIFAVDWLYETCREEDFLLGLSSVSTQVFVKSVPGQFRGKTGHCSLNRTHGALLMPDPDGFPDEALFLSTLEDPRLLSPL
ncbi:MAG TPA: sialidase family protein, partial [Clostridia bacterium]|nr:sialidase family protein [Clostridia bacterium]